MKAEGHISNILRHPALRQGMVLIFLIQLGVMLFTTPLYDIDTNSFIRGGWSWDIYHNPLLNIFIAVFSKVWSNLYFLIGIQLLFYAFAVSFLVVTVFPQDRKFRWIAFGVAALEPVTLFYNLSLLAESFYTSFTLLSVALLILWMRYPRAGTALGFGTAVGFTFLAKLSAMIHLPLVGMMLFRVKMPLSRRLGGMALAMVPFLVCYVFVAEGQKSINGGDLYTVEGRVRWDFSSSQYRPEEIQAPEFKRFVDPYIFDETGVLEPHRERRRELSYLGYKDCVTAYETASGDAVLAINTCDSLFGAVAAQIMDKHFWEAEQQFIADNFRFIHQLNYLDYRFTPGLHYYHPESEYQYLDSLMGKHFGVDLSQREARIPAIWRSLSFGNAYMPVWFWIAVITVIAAGIRWIGSMTRWESLVMGGLAFIPLVFHLVYISYRPRFLAPYIVLILILFLYYLRAWTTGKVNHG